MIKTRRFTPAATAALALVTAAISSFTVGTTVAHAQGAGNNPATECLIQLQSVDGPLGATFNCTDGAACDGDGATNGSCQVQVRACPNVSGVSGCTPQPLKKLKVTPARAGITADLASSACGAFTDRLVLKLRKRNTKDSKPKRLKGMAIAEAKRMKDIDKTKVVCKVCPTESCVTTTTATTTTVPTTTSTTLPCGNGVIDTGETCDPDATPNGCSGGTPFCNTQTCTSCQANCSQLAFTLGTPTTDCGFPGQGANAAPPLTGELRDDTDTKIVAGGDLGSACLYIGGGIANQVPPGPTPDGSTTLIQIADCSQNTAALGPADTGNRATCTVGPKTTRHCTNGHPGTDGNHACTQDADCGPVCVNGQCIDGAGGTDGNGACTANGQCGVSSAGGNPVNVCQPDPNCFFGNPLPIENAGLSTCVLNIVDAGVGGTANIAAGSADATLPLRSWVYLTGLEQEFSQGLPCPICDNGTCNAGPRQGQACTTNSSLKTTLDCPPPDHAFLAPLGVTLGPLTTAPAELASPAGDCVTTGCAGNPPLANCCSNTPGKACSVDADCDGLFCPGQLDGGAFGVLAARKVIENGSPAGGGFDATAKATTLGSVFCIPATNNILIDGAANLPGPGATGLAGTVRLR